MNLKKIKLKKVNLGKLNILHENSKDVPIFFACDDSYVKYLMVTIQSIKSHATLSHEYKIYVLNTDISDENKGKLYDMESRNLKIEFCDVSSQLKAIEKKLSVRDYYSLTTYYRVFIPDLYKQYDKVLYLDSDIIVNQDVANLYKYNLGSNYVGAIQDYAVTSTEVLGEYVEQVLGISKSAYFNAGILLINSKAFRAHNIKHKFLDLLDTYSFVVAQDQDYLNILCQNKVLWIDSKWNVQMSEEKERDLSKVGIIHYNFARKPWNCTEGRYVSTYWEYAKRTADYDTLVELCREYSEKDKAREKQHGENLLHLAQEEIDNEFNYAHMMGGAHSRTITRQEIMEKIAQYEREGRFDEDVEDDPPSRMLMPNEINYLDNSIRKRITTRYAFKVAKWLVRELIHKKQLIIKEYKGIENYRNLTSGAIITCNHFNAFDSFAMHLTYQKSKQYKRRFYRIIKEGNYTSFPGIFGFFMRNCNTLPLSSNSDTMKKFIRAVDKLLSQGHFILIYPEQSMWWNYRKPKPLKKGGYIFAANNNVPVLPCFITMEDSNIPGEGGFPVQEYTIHIAEPIYPDPNKTRGQNVKEMMAKNAEVWKKIYEETYGIPLTYTTENT